MTPNHNRRISRLQTIMQSKADQCKEVKDLVRNSVESVTKMLNESAQKMRSQSVCTKIKGLKAHGQEIRREQNSLACFVNSPWGPPPPSSANTNNTCNANKLNQSDSASFVDINDRNNDLEPKHLRFSKMTIGNGTSAIEEGDSFDGSNGSSDIERAPLQSPYFKNQSKKRKDGKLELQDLEVNNITHKADKLKSSPNSCCSSPRKKIEKLASGSSKYTRDVSVKRWNNKLSQTKNLKSSLKIMTSEHQSEKRKCFDGNKTSSNFKMNDEQNVRKSLNRSHQFSSTSNDRSHSSFVVSKNSRKIKTEFGQSRNKKQRQLQKYSHNTIQEEHSNSLIKSNNKPKHSFNLNHPDSANKSSSIHYSPTKSSIKKQNSSVSRINTSLAATNSLKDYNSKSSTTPVFRSKICIPQSKFEQAATTSNNAHLDDAIQKIESVMLGKQNKVHIQLTRKSPKIGINQSEKFKTAQYDKNPNNFAYRSKTPTHLSVKFLQNSNSVSNSSLKKNNYNHNFGEEKTNNADRRLSIANQQFKSNNSHYQATNCNQTQTEVQQQIKPHHYLSSSHKRNITSSSSSSSKHQRAHSKAQVRKSFGMAVTVRNYYSMMLKIPFRKFIKRFGNYEHILKFCYKRVVPIIERAMLKFIAMKKIKKNLRNYCGKWKFWKDLNIYYKSFLPQITKIQRNYRHYRHKPAKLNIKRFKQQLYAIFIGWRLRKVLACTQLNPIKKQTKQSYNLVQQLKKDRSQSSKMFLRNVKRQFVHLVKDFNSTIDQIIMKGIWVKRRFGISYTMRKSNSHGILKKQGNNNNNKRQTTANNVRNHANSNNNNNNNNAGTVINTQSSRKHIADRNLCKIVGTSIQDKNTRLKERYYQQEKQQQEIKHKLHINVNDKKIDKREEQKKSKQDFTGSIRTPKGISSMGKGFKKLASNNTPNYPTSNQKARLNHLIQGSRKTPNSRLHHQKNHSNSMADFQMDQSCTRYSHKFKPSSVKQFPKNVPNCSVLNRSQQQNAMNFSIISNSSIQPKTSSNNAQMRFESSGNFQNEVLLNNSRTTDKMEEQNDAKKKRIQVVSAKIASPSHRFKKNSSKNKIIIDQPKEQKQILGQISSLFDVVKNKVKTKSDAKNEFQELMKKLQKQLQMECEENQANKG